MTKRVNLPPSRRETLRQLVERVVDSSSCLSLDNGRDREVLVCLLVDALWRDR